MWSNTSMTHSTVKNDESFLTFQADGKGIKHLDQTTNIVPMMIGHLKKCIGNSKTFSGVTIQMITVLAILRKVEQTATKITYEFEDETGTIEGIRYVEGDNHARDPVELNKYFRVFGSLRNNSSQGAYIFVLKIVPVKKYVEIFSHLLEFVHTSMKMKICGSAKGVEGEKMDEDDDDTCHGLINEQKMIYRIIKGMNHTENGIERSEIKEKMPANLQSKVDDILEFLVGDGHIYTAHTDNYFKTT